MIRQYDLCQNPDRNSRTRVPFLIVLQSDLLQPLETVVVAPVVPETPSSSVAKLNPVLTIDGKRYRVLMQELAGVPRNRIGEPLQNLASRHADFIAAVDLLFTGI